MMSLAGAEAAAPSTGVTWGAFPPPLPRCFDSSPRHRPALARALPACRERPVEYRIDGGASTPSGRPVGVRLPDRHAPRVERAEPEAALLRSDALALSIRAARDRLALQLAREAAAFVRSGAWAAHGYARLEDHARERFGRSGRWLRDLAALARAVESLPDLGRALTGDDGGRPVGRVAALIIGRVASSGSVSEWVRLAREVTVRDLRTSVRRARELGSDRPPDRDGVASGGGSGTAGALAFDPSLEDPPCLVRIAAPAPVSAAFEETLDLYRAVVGSEATVTSFIEALVGEARSDPRWDEPVAPDEGVMADGDAADRASPFPWLPPGVWAPPLSRGMSAGRREGIWARATSSWSRLSDRADARWAAALAQVDLDALAEAGGGVASTAEAGDPAGHDVSCHDAAIRRLIALEDRLDRFLGRVLVEMSALGAWTRLGFDGLGHYAEQRLGICRSTACERAAAARQGPRLPALFQAYQQSEIGLDAALRIARLLRGRTADSGTVASWIARAREATTKRLKDEMRALGRAGVVARRSARGASPRPLDDAVWHRSLRRDAGRSRGWVETFGVAALASPKPDVFLSLRLPADLAGDLIETIGAACRGLARRAAGALPGRAVAAGSLPESAVAMGTDEEATSVEEAGDLEGAPLPSERITHRMIGACDGAPPGWVGLLALLEGFVATWDPPARAASAAGVAAARKRRSEEVYARDGWRCSAPGCTSRRNLEDHHIVYRSRGGGDDLRNRTCLCRFHHRMGEHGGLARCRGAAPLGIVWRLGRAGLPADAAEWYRNEIRQPPAGAAERGGPTE